MNSLKLFCLSLSTTLILAGCAIGPEGKYSPDSSYLEQPGDKQDPNLVNKAPDEDELQPDGEPFSMLSPMATKSLYAKDDINLTELFSDTELVRVTADNLRLNDYLHYVLGELLGVNYIIGEDVQRDKQTVTLNIQQEISKRKLFTLSEDILRERAYVIAYSDGIFYIHKAQSAGAKGQLAYGYGNRKDDVPNTSLDIVQMVPLVYGMQTSAANTLKQMLNVKATPDFERSSLLIQGKRRDILRALEFLALIDQPKFSNRHIGMYKATYASTTEIKTKLSELLIQDGLSIADNSTEKAVAIVNLDRVGALIIFANSQDVIDRVVYWANQIDQPVGMDEQQYFIFEPQYSRAADLGASVQALLGGPTAQIESETTLSNENQQANRRGGTRKTQVTGPAMGEMRVVIDERANALIFEGSGSRYRQLLPLIRRLDIMPKQVMLEVLIAEVTLTDEFKQGVEFALNSGSYSLGTSGAFGVGGFGGLSYIVEGSKASAAVNLFASNSLVNILSRPTLVVRDGVEANINVGTDIPTVGSTVTDPVNGTTQSVDYRKTGVEVTVTPTINAQGLVIMEVYQSNSNEVTTGTTVADSPSIFERSITTEVVAASGQTIILGGLISENNNYGVSKVPVLGDIPWLGRLFRSDTETVDRTELVVMITPRVIESSDEWEGIKSDFNEGLKEIDVSVNKN